MTHQEAIKLVEELLEHQRAFKMTCDACVPQERLEALEIIISLAKAQEGNYAKED